MPSIMYFVRGTDGKVRTIMAGSEIGAVKEYMHKYKPSRGDVLSAKERGVGDWTDYDVK